MSRYDDLQSELLALWDHVEQLSSLGPMEAAVAGEEDSAAFRRSYALLARRIGEAHLMMADRHEETADILDAEAP